jgi:hypothetical protein
VSDGLANSKPYRNQSGPEFFLPIVIQNFPAFDDIFTSRWISSGSALSKNVRPNEIVLPVSAQSLDQIRPLGPEKDPPAKSRDFSLRARQTKVVATTKTYASALRRKQIENRCGKLLEKATPSCKVRLCVGGHLAVTMKRHLLTLCLLSVPALPGDFQLEC